MPTVIGYHQVEGHQALLASPMREKVFRPLGVTGIRTFVDPQNPTRVVGADGGSDMNRLKTAMSTPGAAEAMAHDGVLPRHWCCSSRRSWGTISHDRRHGRRSEGQSSSDTGRVGSSWI